MILIRIFTLIKAGIMKIKEEFHYLIDSIDDENVLTAYYQLVHKLIERDTNIWDTLTTEQQRLVALSYDESFDERNLVSHDDVMKKYAKWIEG
jgi:hypothetical protein